MSVLVILLPPRPRTGAIQAPERYAYVRCSATGVCIDEGQAAAAQLPRTREACLVLADTDLSWQRTTIPKAPRARRRAALGAVLEDALLEDDADLHLAREPGAVEGHSAWVAVLRRDWLAAVLEDLDAAGVPLTRVLPSSWPGTPARLHVLPNAVDGLAPLLVHSSEEGVSCLRMAGSLARQRLPAAGMQALRCSAHPAVAVEAERWLEGRVEVLNDTARALQALDSPWNLRQFDLAPRHRGLQGLAQRLRSLRAPQWRALRWGLAAALLVQVAGLNAFAWKLEEQLRDTRQAQVDLLKRTHPQVRSVMDAPLQMQSETERLQSAAGQAGPGDLEPLLGAVAAAWPTGIPPVQSLRYERGRLTLAAPALSGPQQTEFAARLRSAGYESRSQGAQIVIAMAGVR